ncbi:FkbM family methyltransferase [Marinospirillum perlucidum]|uniref:FkbM family methyltransferase n=1 Tax=Marinospirillum perlucidum TaxID=1982602 RepID=UPI000DF1AAD1|nr:FkbM family methyltransferase [Marinospirillum perlucidum]
MSIVSYAQNFEDIMLWRALKDVENGFYIDVGANDPIVESVTKLFYDKKWTGINIEPVKKHYDELCLNRPNDINLHCAVADQSGTLDFWECNIRGWATADQEVMQMHEAQGYEGKRYEVPVRTLQSVCEEYVTSDIHFLKIDVEGFEKAVIQGVDLYKYRPWVLVIEATIPNTQDENYDEWENLVLTANYSFAYSDGLNRFYLANEHIRLLKYFQYPPNVFDEFIRIEQLNSELRAQVAEAKADRAEAKAEEANFKVTEAEAKAEQAEAKAEQAEAKAEQAEAKAEQAEAKAEQAEAKAEQAEQQLVNMLDSRSWKLTKPLRLIGSLARRIKAAMRSVAKQILKPPLIKAQHFINAHPLLKSTLLVVLNRFPTFKARLSRIGRPCDVSAPDILDKSAFGTNNSEYDHLTPSAKQVYAELQEALTKYRGATNENPHRPPEGTD